MKTLSTRIQDLTGVNPASAEFIAANLEVGDLSLIPLDDVILITYARFGRADLKPAVTKNSKNKGIA